MCWTLDSAVKLKVKQGIWDLTCNMLLTRRNADCAEMGAQEAHSWREGPVYQPSEPLHTGALRCADLGSSRTLGSALPTAHPHSSLRSRRIHTLNRLGWNNMAALQTTYTLQSPRKWIKTKARFPASTRTTTALWSWPSMRPCVPENLLPLLLLDHLLVAAIASGGRCYSWTCVRLHFKKPIWASF